MSTESRDTRGLLGKLFGKGSAAALLLAVFLISGTAAGFQYYAFGSGLDSCGSWTAAKEAESYKKQAIFRSWIEGYMTAYSRWVERGSGPVGATLSPGAWAWVDNYCQDNPLESVGDAAEQMIDAIKAK